MTPRAPQVRATPISLLRAGVLAASVVAASWLAASPAAAKSVLFEGGRWFDGKEFVPRAVLVTDGTIRERQGNETPRGLTVVDLGGLWVVPPLADAHTHATADPKEPAADLARFVRAGIFFAKNPNSTWGGLTRGRNAVAAQQPAALEALWSGSGLTSPGGHPAQIYGPHLPSGSGPDGWVEVASAADLDQAFSRIDKEKPDFVKVYLEGSEEHARRKDDAAFAGRRGLDPALLPEIVSRAHRGGRPVSAHVRTAADFRAAVAASVDEINHLPLEAITDEDARACAKRGIRVVTTVLSHRSTLGIDDPNSIYRVSLRRLHDAGAPLALGTDNMRMSVVDELRAVAGLGVFTSAELVVLATTESIRAVMEGKGKPPPNAGTLRVGEPATFLVLKRDPIAYPAAFGEIANRFVRGEPIPEPDVPEEKPTLADELVQIAMHDGVDAVVATYREWRRDRPDDFDYGEPQLNALGYALLEHGRTADAVTILELNAEQFPRSPNAWDSLAEAQLANGDRVGAAQSSRRVLQFLPDAKGLSPELRAQLAKSADERSAID